MATEWLNRSRAAAIVLGSLGYVASMSPSLIPRSPLMQGIVSGVSLAAWYSAGVLLDRAWARFTRWSGLTIALTRPTPRRVLSLSWALLIGGLLVLSPFAFLRGQRELAAEMGMPPPGGWQVLLAIAVAIAVFSGLVGLWHGIRRLFDALLGRLDRWPRALAAPFATVVVVALVVGVVQYAILGGLLRVVGERSAEANQTSPPGASAPLTPLLSGGPGSLEAWDTLGYEGRSFISGATSVQQIRSVTGGPATQSIRVYAGRETGRSIAAAADAVVAELDRTGAWSRSVIVLFTTTGQGWVNNWEASAIEYLTGGDCALAAIQHSVLPSPIALLDAPNRPREAGKAVLAAVRERLVAIPEGDRPALHVAGESLGAYGGNAAFATPEAMLAEVDGAVWTGTPSFTPLHAQITADRVVGSAEVNPVVDNGRHVRFASRPAELTADQYGRALGPWEHPRVVYLQHPSDPVVWWSPSLLFSTPDWLRETRVDGPAAQMSWLPVVTFWQVTADMAVSQAVPSGFGHNYHDEVVPTWAAVLDRDTPSVQVDAIVSAIRDRANGWE